MGACQNTHIYVVCSYGEKEDHHLVYHLHKDELIFEPCDCASPGAGRPAAVSSGAPGDPREKTLLKELERPPDEKRAAEAPPPPAEPAAPAAEGRAAGAPAPAGPEVSLEYSPEKANLLLELTESLHLTGNFAKWSTSYPQTQLQPVPSGSANVARLKLCVKMTSVSFSFQVVSSKRRWAWRLYPRDAKPLKWAHVSKEGRLQPDTPDAVAVGLGDNENGHGLNFHVVEDEPTTVTIWVEVPVSSTEDGLVLQTGTVAGARVWYTREDTGVQFAGGDGVDLNKYKWLRPSGW